jgi:YD repeat-containing protein
VRDLRGLPTQITNGNSVVTNLTYDNAGRVLTKTYPAATGENITYTYDNITAGNKGKGRLTKIQDQTGSTAFVYDARGNVVTETRTIGTLPHTIGYVYDLADRVTQITYPSGRIVTYTRDTTGRISAVSTKQNAGATAQNLATSIAYQPLSTLVTGFGYGNGLSEWMSYTTDQEISGHGVTNGASNVINRSFARSDKINITNIYDNVTAANNCSLGYSAANRLTTSYFAPWGQNTYTYDGVGNRKTDVYTNPSSVVTNRTYTYNSAANKLANVKIGTTTERTFVHDNGGNITSDTRSGTAYVYSYNKRNRLKTVTVGGVLKSTYTYNGLEQSTIRVLTNMTPSGTTHFIYDRFGNLIAETAGGGATGSTGTVREYIYLPETEISPTFGSRTVVDRPLAVVNAVNTTPVIWAVHVLAEPSFAWTIT